MGTEKRERQKANRQQRQIEEGRAARSGAVKRNVIRWVVGGVAAIGAVVLIAWLGGAFDDDEEQIQSSDEPPVVDQSTLPAVDETVVPATTIAEAAPTTVPEMADPTECPATDGSEEQRREFSEYPPFCIDVAKTYTADIVTNFGEMTVEFDAERAPLTVNNFVTLARYKYFDDSECHRAIPDFVVQCGDPTATGTGGPGYSFADELPQAGEYEVGSIAMANSGPDTNGSQFFIITGEQGAALPPQYSLFGAVAVGVSGVETVEALNAVANPESNGVPPLDQILIESVTITES